MNTKKAPQKTTEDATIAATVELFDPDSSMVLTFLEDCCVSTFKIRKWLQNSLKIKWYRISNINRFEILGSNYCQFNRGIKTLC